MAEERAGLARRKEEREKLNIYLDVGVISDESFRHHNGFDLTSADLAPSDPAAPKMYRILRTTKLGDFVQQIGKEKELNSEQIRFWDMVNRQNKTIRPDKPLIDHDSTFEKLLGTSIRGGKFYLWLEVADMVKEGMVFWPQRLGSNGTILVFLKHSDELNKRVTGVGHIHIRKNDKIDSLSPHIIKTMNWPAGTQVLYSEVKSEKLKWEYVKTKRAFKQEIKPNMIIPMQFGQTFSQLEIQDGDVIRFHEVV
jgi:ubiquitin carboxyl-terminal hydrolase 7